jgi:uncharacterized membrane protein YgdD (TMEM256/DUF423 family)
MDRILFAAGALSAAIAVGTGAFAAHGLKKLLEPDAIAVWETGARYQMYAALGLMAAAWAAARWPGPLVAWGGWLLVAGTVIFSGSLYALSASGVRWLGAITPLGGVAFIAGWVLLAAAALRAPG